jgi:hypothetical protein
LAENTLREQAFKLNFAGASMATKIMQKKRFSTTTRFPDFREIKEI